MSDSNLKLAVLVDNPLRDLNGVMLLAGKLADLGCDVFIVEMYNQLYDISMIVPDVVIVNYCRANNVEYLKYYKSLGASIIVLDTEGSWTEDLSRSVNDAAKYAKMADVDYYFFWGNKQKNAFEATGLLDKGKLFVTGCPRHDFCMNNSHPSPLSDTGTPPNYILINTRYPRSNPRFTRGDRDEIKGMVNAGFSLVAARQYLKDDYTSRDIFLDALSVIINDFPKQFFIIRPHPFENDRIYQEFSKSFTNVRVVREGTSIDMISKASLLIHQNCTTSIEANLLNKPCISLEWFNTDNLLSPIARDTSENAWSIDQLARYIRNVISGSVEVKVSSLVYDYFNYDVSSEGAAARISNIIDNERHKLKSKGIVVHTSSSLSLGVRLKLKFVRIFGYGLFRTLRMVFRYYSHVKSLNKEIDGNCMFQILDTLRQRSFISNNVRLQNCTFPRGSGKIFLLRNHNGIG